MAIRVHRRDNDCARLETRDFAGARSTNLQHHIGAERFLGRDEDGARSLIFSVWKPSVSASATFDGDLRPQSDELLDSLRSCRDAGFPRIRFRRRGYPHQTSPETVDLRADMPLLGVSPAQRRQLAAVGTDLDHRPSSRNANGGAESVRRGAAEMTETGLCPAGTVDVQCCAVSTTRLRQARATASAKRSLVLSRTSSVSNLRTSASASSCAALGLLDLTKKLRDRTLEIVAPD